MTDKIPVPPVGAAPATAEHFQVASQRPAVKFLSRGVQPPSQVYVTNQDVLTLLAASSQTAEAITVTYRLLRADGELISGQFIFPITGDNNLNVKSEPLAEGFLLSTARRRNLHFHRCSQQCALATDNRIRHLNNLSRWTGARRTFEHIRQWACYIRRRRWKNATGGRRIQLHLGGGRPAYV